MGQSRINEHPSLEGPFRINAEEAMTHTMMAQPSLAPAPESTTTPGPLVAAVGGVDPDSVLRAARVLTPASPDGVIAVSVVAPLPAAIPGEASWMIPTGYEEERFSDCMAELSTRLESFGELTKSWSRQVVRGTTAFALTNFARERHAAMLIVGIGRHRPIDRIFGGETALRMIQRAPCPVLIVHPTFDAPFHDVVIATDFSPASVAAARAAMPLLSPVATLHVVHVWQPSASTDPHRKAADEAYTHALLESFRRFVDLLAVPPGIAVKTVTREGRAVERILEYATVHHADLITAGRHGHSLVQRILVGSHTTALLRAAQQSLLVAPEPPFAERDQLQLFLSGALESDRPAEWEAMLRALTVRNQGRPTVVEVDDLLLGAQVRESGYVLRAASYDAKMKRVELTVDDASQPDHRVTRLIGGVNCVAIDADAAGRDLGLRIDHGGARTTVTFLAG